VRSEYGVVGLILIALLIIIEVCVTCAEGVVEHVVLLGAPISVNKVKLQMARCMVSGRFVNGHCVTDWLLKLCSRFVHSPLSPRLPRMLRFQGSLWLRLESRSFVEDLKALPRWFEFRCAFAHVRRALIIGKEKLSEMQYQLRRFKGCMLLMLLVGSAVG
jgi:hypothetical protein